MAMQQKFTDAELERIIDQGLIYMCACPAQVAQSIQQLRSLLNYQQNCLTDPGNDGEVHRAIVRAALAAQNIMEACMERILELERWDRETLTMPSGLRQRQAREISD
ncbi:MAG: hypothetical protein OHK0048_19310 [Rhodoferax sp.]